MYTYVYHYNLRKGARILIFVFCAKITRMTVFGFSVTEAILFLPLKCYNAFKEVIIMMELEDSRQELKYISEDLRAIRTAALMADEARE